MTSPIQTFKNNIRPAHLMLRIYSLLDTNDHLVSDGEMVEALRGVVRASADEALLLVYNEIFLGLVRQEADLPQTTLKQVTLQHLLRQAVVASCTGLDTYLPALLRVNLPLVIQAVGRDFVPRDDASVSEYLKDLTFTLDDVLRLLDDPNAAEYISTKIFGLTDFSYLSSRKGVHVTGRLLGLLQPWEQIAQHLRQDRRELMKTLDDTVRRRNDIIHRADRSQDDPEGAQQEISYAWAKQAVDTVEHICLALDELVAERMNELRAVTDGQ